MKGVQIKTLSVMFAFLVNVQCTLYPIDQAGGLRSVCFPSIFLFLQLIFLPRKGAVSENKKVPYQHLAWTCVYYAYWHMVFRGPMPDVETGLVVNTHLPAGDQTIGSAQSLSDF